MDLLNYSCDTNHNKCILLSNKIQSLYNHKTLDSTTLTDYLEFLANSEECYKLQSHRNTVSNLVNEIVPTTHDICMIVDIFRDMTSTDGVKILQKLIDRKIEIHSDILLYVLRSKCILTLAKIRDLLLTIIIPDTKCLEEICLFGYFELILRICNQKVKATTKSLENLLKYYSCQTNYSHANYTTEVIMNYITILLKHGANADITCLKIACETKNIKVVEKMLSFKIKPDKSCFDTLIRGNYNRPAKDANLVANIIDILIQYGYTLTMDDVICALKQGYYVNNIKRFNFTFDDAFSTTCYKVNYFPYKEIELVKTMECLRIECRKTKNIKKIKDLVAQGFKPDIECLRDACKLNMNFANINYLVKGCKIKPDFDCIRNIAKGLRSAGLDLLIDEYDKPVDEIINEDDESISGNDDDDNSISEDEEQDKKRFEICPNCKAKFKTENGYKDHMRRCNWILQIKS